MIIIFVRNLIQYKNLRNMLEKEGFVKKNVAGIINFSTIFDDKNFERNKFSDVNNRHDQTISFEWEEGKEKIEKNNENS